MKNCSEFPDLENKVAIVSGGSRGIGKAIVLELARNRVKVAFNFLSNTELANSTFDEVKRLGMDVFIMQGDIRNFEFVKKFVNETKNKFGRIDYLINNAGILKDKSLMLMSESDWGDVINTNLNGAFNLSKLVIMSFLKQKSGAIVNISSTAGILGSVGQVNYSSSKAGLIGMTKSLAREVAPYGIRVNAVAPGFIETDMVKGIKEKNLISLMSNVPMKRMGKAIEVAKVVTFLLSEASSYVTGQVIPIDGGLAI